MDAQFKLALGGTGSILSGIIGLFVSQQILSLLEEISADSVDLEFMRSFLESIGLYVIGIGLCLILLSIGFFGGGPKFKRASGSVAGTTLLMASIGVSITGVIMYVLRDVIGSISLENIETLGELVFKIIASAFILVGGIAIFLIGSLFFVFSGLVYFLRSPKGYIGALGILLLMASPFVVFGNVQNIWLIPASFFLMGICLYIQATISLEMEEEEFEYKENNGIGF